MSENETIQSVLAAVTTGRKNVRRNPVTDALILSALQAGHSLDIAPILAGCSKSAFRLWRNADPVFARRCAEARRQGLESVARARDAITMPMSA